MLWLQWLAWELQQTVMAKGALLIFQSGTSDQYSFNN
jgi:hypothetical protein